MTISQTLTVRNAPRPSFCLTLMLAFQSVMIGMERTGDVRNKDRHVGLGQFTHNIRTDIQNYNQDSEADCKRDICWSALSYSTRYISGMAMYGLLGSSLKPDKPKCGHVMNGSQISTAHTTVVIPITMCTYIVKR